jgi:hypothetical protein
MIVSNFSCGSIDLLALAQTSGLHFVFSWIFANVIVRSIYVAGSEFEYSPNIFLSVASLDH